mmetsp:Transcript_24084/g.37165  ORF Transcript_24084/g.37165 Transcript_24084/m.37165 type:complete len:131 (+) Transcript_24084:52-444(+)
MTQALLLLRHLSKRAATTKNLPHYCRTLSTSDETITKKDIIKKVAEDYELSKTQSERIVQTVLDTIVENVSEGKRVTLSGFGAFFSTQQKERSGTNPKGINWYTPAKVVPKFRAMTTFKDAVEQAGKLKK